MLYLYIALGILAGAIVVTFIVCVARTPRRNKKEFVLVAQPEREKAYAESLSQMVQIPTVSVAGQEDRSKFLPFHDLMRKLFPHVFEACECHELEGCLLLKWKGASDEQPVLFLSHMDVVEATNTDKWTHPPFSGAIVDGQLWGRGSADTKCSLFAFFQSAEELIQTGYTPANDIYLASSCTEEVNGPGAGRIVAWLQEHGVRLSILFDEGGSLVTIPKIPCVKGTIALVGVCEKGYGDLKFIARGKGGHASMPPKKTPITQLAKFELAVVKHKLFKEKFDKPVLEMFRKVAPQCAFPVRFLLANTWLIRPILKPVLRYTQLGAMLRTTISFTMQKGSDGRNVIPNEAYVTANMRYIHHQNRDESIEVIRKFAAKYGLETEVFYSRPASKQLDSQGKTYKLVEDTINKVFPGVSVAPYAMTGCTDTAFFPDVTEDTVRFAPAIYSVPTLLSVHGLNEHIETNMLPAMVDFYSEIIKGLENY